MDFGKNASSTRLIVWLIPYIILRFVWRQSEFAFFGAVTSVAALFVPHRNTTLNNRRSKTMKQILVLSIMLTLIMCLTLTSCGLFPKANQENRPSEAIIEISEDGYIVVNGEKTEHKVEQPDEITVSSDGYVVVNENKTSYKAHVHEYGEWSIEKEATESENGVITRLCSCGNKETDLIYAKGTVGITYLIDSITNEATVFSVSNCETTDIVIPEMINDVKVTKIVKEAFYNNQTVTSVKIGNNVTEIPDEAFRYCSKLRSVVIGDSVKSVGQYAFQRCNELRNLTIGSSVVTINDFAFEQCSELVMVAIPDSAELIGNSAFASCSRITNLTLGNNVSVIGENAFNGCSSISSLMLPESLTTIGSSAFRYLERIISVSIPNGVTEIGNYAFADCSRLANLTLSKNLSYIGKYAFFSTGIYNLMIPDSVTIIDDAAFYSCQLLTSVELGKGIKEIGESAFRDCFLLTNLVFTHHEDMIIDFYAFMNCNITGTIELNGVKILNDEAFAYNSNLEVVIISKDLNLINWGVFRDTKLSIIYYEGSENEWNEISISYHYNAPLSSAIKYFYSEAEPTEDGNYWHYIDGVPTVWRNDSEI